jgi:hypothetical protein
METLQVGNSAPAVTITAPADESADNAGDTILFRGTATDPAQGALPASSFRWAMTFYHAEHTMAPVD